MANQIDHQDELLNNLQVKIDKFHYFLQESFYDVFYRKRLYHFYLDFIAGIKNIFIWLPAIWGDRQWDNHYIELILRFKLVKMVKYFTKYGISADNDIMIKQMNFCIRILDRLLADDYMHPDYHKWFDDAWKKDSNVEWLHRDLTAEEEMNKEKWWAWEAHWYERDRKLLFKMFEKYENNWWD